MQGSKLFVGNLSFSVNAQQLTELFAQYGEVKQVNIVEGKGFGFVEMANPEEAQKAKDALTGTEFQGRGLRIDEARPPQKRQRRDFRRF
ncbi:MAG: RNA-binding protein [Candidatus Schekmanbacteria bacterium]|nr:RNA-binding protein [Candidatus Schekmanbacteria bacterium]